MNLVVRIGDEFVTPPLGGQHPRRASRAIRCITLLREWGFAGAASARSAWRS